jgi:DNA-binding LytR/AlgR family response regulator
MIKVIALDDEATSLKVIENFCGRISDLHLEKSFDNPTQALKYINKFPVDVLFLDINMPQMSGIEFYKSLKQNTLVIFITTSKIHAVEGFNLNAIDYLLKPFSFERFEQAISKVKDYMLYKGNKSASNEHFIFVRADYSLMKINLNDIAYIEGLDDYIKIFIHQQKTVVTRMTMKGIVERLPTDMFIRIHRSFIAPLSSITQLKSKTVVLGDKELPIGKVYEEQVKKAIKPA